MNKTHSLKDFLPLLAIYAGIILLTALKLFFIPAQHGMYWHAFMYDFMGIMFIVMGILKILDLKGFAHSFSMYDLIAQRVNAYGFIYPFIELTIGCLYLFRSHLMIANWATLIFMSIGTVGVWLQLSQKRHMEHSCMGVVKVPLTYITLLENVVMALMAIMMMYM